MVVSPGNRNKYHDHQTNQPKRVRYRLILVQASDLDWLKGDRLKDTQAKARAGHKWIHFITMKPFYMHTPPTARIRPTYVCLPSGLYSARAGRVLVHSGPDQEITPLPGIYFFDGWRVHPTLVTPANLQAQKRHQYVRLKPLHTACQRRTTPLTGGRGARHPRYRCQEPN